MLYLINVSINHKNKIIIQDVNIDLEYGDCVTITGASGTGKTSLLNVLALNSTYNGEYYLNNKIVNSANKYDIINKHISFSNQEADLFSDLTVIENLSIYNQVTKAEIDRLLNYFNLAEKKHSSIKMLSGGERQRVSIIKTLIKDKDIIIFDEPTAFLDSENINKLIKLIEELINQRKAIIVFATHDQRLLKLANKIYKIEDSTLKLTSYAKIKESTKQTNKKAMKNFDFNLYLKKKIKYNRHSLLLKYLISVIALGINLLLIYCMQNTQAASQIYSLIHIGRRIMLLCFIVILDILEVIFLYEDKSNMKLLLQEGLSKKKLQCFYIKFYSRTYLPLFLGLSVISLLLGQSIMTFAIAMTSLYLCTYIIVIQK